MDSLYGGKPGLSFVLKGKFSSIEEMNAAFSEGDSYTKIWYGEHCIIDTPNKNNPDNGKIFRRGINYATTTTSSIKNSLTECIGQIVGPSSGTPSFIINELKQNKDQQYELPKEASVKETSVKVLIDNKVYDGFLRESSSEQPAAITFKEGSKEEPNNQATYKWKNIRVDATDQNESNSWFGVELTIPTQTNVFSAESVSPYVSGELCKTTKVNDFYQEHLISIPRGVQGISITNLEVKVLSPGNYYGPADIFNGINEDGTFKENIDKTRTVETTASFIVCTITGYQEKNSQSFEDIILCSYDQISKVEVTNEGNLVIQYTGEKEQSEVFLDFIKSATLTSGNGSEGGTLIFKDAKDQENSKSSLSWVKNIDITNEGKILLTFAGIPNDTSLDKYDDIDNGVYQIKNKSLIWPREINLEEDTGRFILTNNQNVSSLIGQINFPTEILKNKEVEGGLTVTYSKDEPKNLNLGQVTNVYIEEGNLFATLNDGSKDGRTEPLTKDKPFYSVVDISLEAENDKVSLVKTIAEKAEGENKETLIEDLSVLASANDAIIFNKNEKILEIEKENGVKREPRPLLIGDRKIHVQYSVPEDTERSFDPINSIEDITIYKNQLFVLFSDINIRKEGYADETTGALKAGWEKNLNGNFYTKELAEAAKQENIVTDYLWKSIGNIDPAGYQFADIIYSSKIAEIKKPSGEGAGSFYNPNNIGDILLYLEDSYFATLIDSNIKDKIKNGYLVAVGYGQDSAGEEDDFSRYFFRKESVVYNVETEEPVLDEDGQLTFSAQWVYLGSSAAGGVSESIKEKQIGITSLKTDQLRGSEEEFFFFKKDTPLLATDLINPWEIRA